MLNFVRPFVHPLMKCRRLNRLREVGSNLKRRRTALWAHELNVSTMHPCLDMALARRFTGNEAWQ